MAREVPDEDKNRTLNNSDLGKFIIGAIIFLLVVLGIAFLIAVAMRHGLKLQ